MVNDTHGEKTILFKRKLSCLDRLHKIFKVSKESYTDAKSRRLTTSMIDKTLTKSINDC